MTIRFRYSEWDGTQEIGPLDPDDRLAAGHALLSF